MIIDFLSSSTLETLSTDSPRAFLIGSITLNSTDPEITNCLQLYQLQSHLRFNSHQTRLDSGNKFHQDY